MHRSIWLGFILLTAVACEATDDEQQDVQCDEAAAMVPGNLVPDPEFEQGLLCWYAAQGGDSNRGFELSDDHTADGSAPSAVGTNDNTQAESYHTQLVSRGFHIESGTTYSVSFAAKAAESRVVTVYVQACCEPMHHFHSAQPTIGTDWQTIEATFTADATFDDAYFEVQMGEAMGAVWVDDVTVFEL